MNSHIFIYIDGENRGDIDYLPKIENGKYFYFLGMNQKDSIKCEKGMKLKKIKMDKQEKNYLDCNLIDCLQKRINLKNTIHYIISEDKDYLPWIIFYNTKVKKEIVKQIHKIDEIDKKE